MNYYYKLKYILIKNIYKNKIIVYNIIKIKNKERINIMKITSDKSIETLRERERERERELYSNEISFFNHAINRFKYKYRNKL